MPKWPKRIPYDLNQMIEEVEGHRSHTSNQDRWAAFVEWLEGNAVEPPARIELWPELNSND